jgi:hypothetical protein
MKVMLLTMLMIAIALASHYGAQSAQQQPRTTLP